MRSNAKTLVHPCRRISLNELKGQCGLLIRLQDGEWAAAPAETDEVPMRIIHDSVSPNRHSPLESRLISRLVTVMMAS